MQTVDLLIFNAAQVLSMEHGLGLIENGALAIHKNQIIAVGKSAELIKQYQGKKTLKATGKVITPGLIDCHTHLLFAGYREDEYLQRLNGDSYLKILERGGGILNSVEKMRSASYEDLIAHGKKWLKEFQDHGVTTVEIKSGYGLDYKTEKKMLEVIKVLKSETGQEIVSTFLGAHTFPKEAENDKGKYIEQITEKMLPEFRGLAENCDIFIEKGAFSYEQAETILSKAKEYGYNLKIHTNQMHSMGGIKLAKKFKALSVEHLDNISEDEINLLAETDTIAVLLPGTSFFLKEENWAPARKLLDKKITIALSTDFNPGTSPSANLHFIMNLAVQKLNMLPEEVWQAITINAAKALKREKESGSLVPGKKAHIVIWDMPNYIYPFYHFGKNFVEKVLF